MTYIKPTIVSREPLRRIPIGTRVMVDYKYASPTPYEGEVLEYNETHNTYRVADVERPWYDVWLIRDHMEPIWATIADTSVSVEDVIALGMAMDAEDGGYPPFPEITAHCPWCAELGHVWQHQECDFWIAGCRTENCPGEMIIYDYVSRHTAVHMWNACNPCPETVRAIIRDAISPVVIGRELPREDTFSYVDRIAQRVTETLHSIQKDQLSRAIMRTPNAD